GVVRCVEFGRVVVGGGGADGQQGVGRAVAPGVVELVEALGAVGLGAPGGDGGGVGRHHDVVQGRGVDVQGGGVGGGGGARVGAGDGVVGGHRGGAGVGDVLTAGAGGGADGQQGVGRAVAPGVVELVEALGAVGLGAPGGDGD